MALQHLSFYLKKFENLGLRESNIKKATIESVKKFSGVELQEGDIKFVRDQIKINKTGPEKTEIFLYRDKIEKEINSQLNQKSREVDYKKSVR
jgi:hypothetical protein